MIKELTLPELAEAARKLRLAAICSSDADLIATGILAPHYFRLGIAAIKQAEHYLKLAEHSDNAYSLYRRSRNYVKV